MSCWLAPNLCLCVESTEALHRTLQSPTAVIVFFVYFKRTSTRSAEFFAHFFNFSFWSQTAQSHFLPSVGDHVATMCSSIFGEVTSPQAKHQCRPYADPTPSVWHRSINWAVLQSQLGQLKTKRTFLDACGRGCSSRPFSPTCICLR